MANPEPPQTLRQGIEAWNTWRNPNENIIPDLREATLSGADLQRADLHGATTALPITRVRGALPAVATWHVRQRRCYPLTVRRATATAPCPAGGVPPFRTF